MKVKHIKCWQCDQIGRFIGLWATFISLWQQLICPNLPNSWAIFAKVSKSINFLVKSFWATFIDIWQFFPSHTDCWLHEDERNGKFGETYPSDQKVLKVKRIFSSKQNFANKTILFSDPFNSGKWHRQEN